MITIQKVQLPYFISASVWLSFSIFLWLSRYNLFSGCLIMAVVAVVIIYSENQNVMKKYFLGFFIFLV